jgi:hypothetical protein
MVKLYLSFPLKGRSCNGSVSSQLNRSKGVMKDVLLSKQVVFVRSYALALRNCRIFHMAPNNPTIITQSRCLENMDHGALMSSLYRASSMIMTLEI